MLLNLRSSLMLTAYGVVKNTNLKPTDNVVIVGAGGLGLMAIQLAKAVTGAKIIAMCLFIVFHFTS
jgi:alcohol dehydrogenase, propanol-preferring